MDYVLEYHRVVGWSTSIFVRKWYTDCTQFL